VLGEVDCIPGIQAVTNPESIFLQLRDDHVARMVALRNGSAERELLTRMVLNHELVRRQVSTRLDPIQPDLPL
jgi:hypothetical protein